MSYRIRRAAPIGEAFGLDSPEDDVEIAFAHLERIVVDHHPGAVGKIRNPLSAVGKIERERTVHAHRREIADRLLVDRKPAKNLADATLSRAGTTVWLSSIAMTNLLKNTYWLTAAGVPKNAIQLAF
jgi:hypothetical protein